MIVLSAYAICVEKNTRENTNLKSRHFALYYYKYPTMHKFVSLLSTNDDSIIFQIALHLAKSVKIPKLKRSVNHNMTKLSDYL